VRGFESRASGTSSRAARVGVIAACTLVFAAGCFESSTQPAGGGASNMTTLSWNDLSAQAGLSAEQAAALAPAHGAWQRDEASWSARGGDSGEPPVLDFLAASAAFIDRGQMGRMAAAVHVYEAGRISIPVLDDPLLGPGGRGPGMSGHGGPGRGHRPGDPGGELGLTPEQLRQIRAARQTFFATVHELVQQLRAGTITRDDFDAGVEGAQGAFETSLQSILTAEQYAQLQTARRDRIVAHLTRRVAEFDANLARHVAVLDRILDLSDAQAAGITTIVQNSKPPVEAVLTGLQDNTLTPQAAQAQLKQIAADTAAAIRATLTPEQAALFDTLTHLRRLFPGCRP